LTVAASSDFFINGTLLTDFSNFGPSIVDVLAPGEKIYSTIPGANNHGFLQGTSMAAPIVSHIAALIRSYYPKLSAVDVKKIIKQSVWKPNEPDFSYDIPQKEETKSLQEIASAGGIVNAEKALQIASILNSQKVSNKTKYKSPPNK
jgi:subtilisin family serine protease